VRFFYSLLVYLLRPIAFAVVLWRGLRNRLYWVALGERFGLGSVSPSPAIWLHAVSLGEVNAAAAIVRALHDSHSRSPLIVTTATPTGRARAQALFRDGAAVRYLPYDTPGSTRRFIRRAKPVVAIIMETELWPNLFNQCRRRGIPVVLASARLSPKSVARYRRFGALFRPVFSGATFVAAQSAEDADRFIAIGADRARTRVVGNVKFDVSLDPAMLERGRALRSAWATRPVWIAGSTHAGEEEMVLTAHSAVLADAPDALLLLVPRHPERFQAVADLLGRRGFRYERRSSSGGLGPVGTLPPEAQVLLVDTVGELAAMYAAVDVAFVGGSLVPVGGHNLVEPAALGVPVVTGPYQSNGKEVAQLLLQSGGALEAADTAGLAAVVRRLLADSTERQRVGASGRRVVDANRGSVARVLELVEQSLNGSERPSIP
jgi:3-deoxy-D-manno-octulosonic-acid transferase